MDRTGCSSEGIASPTSSGERGSGPISRRSSAHGISGLESSFGLAFSIPSILTVGHGNAIVDSGHRIVMAEKHRDSAFRSAAVVGIIAAILSLASRLPAQWYS